MSTYPIARSSSIPSYDLCHGKPAAEAGMPDTKTFDSVTGDQIHAMMASNDFSSATPDEMETIASLVRMSASVEEDLIGNRKRTKIIKEREFHIFEQGLPVIVGHPDRVLIWNHDGEERALIIDFKSGHLEVDSAEENLQLLCYAIAIWQELGIKRIFAKIIQPMSKGHKVVEYDEQALKDGLHYVLSILAETRKPNAARTPSEVACCYCKALGTSRCPETSGLVEKAAVEIETPLTGEEIARRLDVFAIAEKIIKKEEALYKAMLEKDANAIPGFYLKPGNVRRIIPNSQRAFEVVEPSFFEYSKSNTNDDEEAAVKALAIFQGCVTVSIGKLEDALGEATGLKGIALDNKCEELLKPLIVEAQNAPSLSKKSKAMLKLEAEASK